ncbi:MAG: VOC family protein [Chloroflexi bacterium]|nr:VOC family protein [Chloroflexota bacterium]
MNTPHPTFQGLRTAIYHAPDIFQAKIWYSKVLGIQPYFDQPFYVGFNVGGFELGLDPDQSSTPGGHAGVIVYWGVPRLEAALEHLVSHGATRRGEIQEVGGGIRLATVFDPFGNILGIIENPHFPNTDQAPSANEP